MLKNDIYNIDREFDYTTVKTIVLKSLVKLAKEEALKERLNVSNDFILGYARVDDNHNNVIDAAPPAPLLKLKIRNTTKYLYWRIAVLKRDDSTCRICHTSVKDNKSLGWRYIMPKHLMIFA
jgi:hypothetical protein